MKGKREKRRGMGIEKGEGDRWQYGV